MIKKKVSKYLFPICMGVIPIIFEMYVYPNLLFVIFILIASVSVSLLILISDTRYTDKLLSKSEKEDLIRIADSLYKQISIGKRFKSALITAIKGIGHNGICYKTLLLLIKYMDSGMTLDSSVNSVTKKIGREGKNTLLFIKGFDCSGYEMPTASKIYTEYKRLTREYDEVMEKNSGSVQRYITMSMVAGTIFPSFVLFGFIGYSIMNLGIEAITALLVGLLIIVPGAYVIIRSKLAGAYNG